MNVIIFYNFDKSKFFDELKKAKTFINWPILLELNLKLNCYPYNKMNYILQIIQIKQLLWIMI